MREIRVIKAAEASDSVVLVKVLCNDDFVSRVVLGLVERIAYRDLDHLTVLQEVTGAHLDRAILLMPHHDSLLSGVWVFDVGLFFLLKGLSRAKEPIKLLHLLGVFLSEGLLDLHDVLSCSLLVLLLLLCLSLLEKERYLQ